MTERLLMLLALLGAGALSGWVLGGETGLEIGLAASAVLWVSIDTVRGLRVLRWLADPDQEPPDVQIGLLGQVVDRVRRALRQRDREIAEARARLDEFLAAIQASPNGVTLLDPEGRIEWCNQTAADHFGFDPRRDLLQLVGNLVRDPAFANYLARGDFSREVVMPGPRSALARPVRLSVQLHTYGAGRRLLLSRDVTAVEQAEVMRRDFVANVSHEIRTPLTVLAGFVETLRTLPLNDDERQRYLGLMSVQAERMQTLVNDLLTLSRLEGSPLPGVQERADVTALLTQCEHEAHALSAGQHRISFALDAPCEIAGSAAELQSALSNLVTNAVRYTPAGGEVAVRWRRLDDGRAEFSVRDSGPGIAPEHVPRLTERFYRVDRSRSRETGGTGLGLAIVKHVAQRHGAELRIDSTPGVGSTFSLLFPAQRLRTPQPEAPAESLTPAPARPAATSATASPER